MDPHGSASRTDGDFLDLEPDEELLCSVSDITEHLGRNITVVLDTALSEIRKMVSIRIRVLKMELHQKSEEIEILKARLGSIQRDCAATTTSSSSNSSSSGGSGPSGEASPRKADCNPASKHGSVDPRRVKTLVPGVKKENINAICDYLMKDKNSRGPVVELEGNQSQVHHQEAEPDSLHLWPDGGMASSGPGHGDTESATDDIFAMLPSGSKRMYDYEWISPMAYSSDLKVMKEPGCESAPTGEANNNEDDDEDDEDDNLPRRDGGGLEHGHAPLSHVQPPDFSMENSPGEGEGPLRATVDRAATGQPFISSHTYICSLCGTFCPDAVFLEEHLKLIHPDAAAAAAAAAAEEEEQQQQAGRPLQSTCCTESRSGGGEQQEGTGGAGVAAGASGGLRGGGGPFKKENKLEGGYECGDCGRHFNYLGNLRQHQRIHTGEKPFVCPECGERFRHAARLKSHRLVHSGAQSPFPCPQCGKGFSVLSGLKRHQRVHTGESPYACPQCGRRFKELGNLYTHQRIHSGATPYRCQHCGRSFRHLGTFKSHRCTPPPQ